MYLRGEGVKQDPLLAKMWFERGVEYGEKESHNGLGIIWRDGLVDGKKDMKKALGYFAAAATQELAEAQVNIGKYHYGESMSLNSRGCADGEQNAATSSLLLLTSKLPSARALPSRRTTTSRTSSPGRRAASCSRTRSQAAHVPLPFRSTSSSQSVGRGMTTCSETRTMHGALVRNAAARWPCSGGGSPLNGVSRSHRTTWRMSSIRVSCSVPLPS